MRRKIAFMCALLCFILDISYGKHRSKCHNRLKANKFDVLIFTQHWPQTVCFLWKEKSESHACKLPKDNEWSIHGIWPTKYGQEGPFYCNNSLPFDITALEPLKDELNTKWIDVENGTAPYSLWRHEWNKHGTCAAELEPLNTEYKYFRKGLDLLDIYDMKNVLEKANIIPGLSYEVQDILNGVQTVLGKKGQIVCVKNKDTQESYLFEIRICFDKTLQLIDCDGIKNFPIICDESEKVIYIGNVPPTYQVIQI